MVVWRNAKIRTKVATGFLIAVVGLVGFAFALVIDRRDNAEASGEVHVFAALSVKAGNLLHETQRERGRTSQFISSKGSNFRTELDAQRGATDDKVADYRQYADRVGPSLPSGVRAALAKVGTALDGLAALRTQASGLTVGAAQVISGYTDLNRALLSTIAVSVSLNGSPTVSGRLHAYLALLSAKEMAGLERAQLANVFTVDRFAAGQFVTVSSIIGAQQAYLTVFERAAHADTLKDWQRIQTAPSFVQVATLEKAALDKAVTGGFGVSAGTWFDAATAKINLYKELEDSQAAAILTAAKAEQASATSTKNLALAVAGGLLLVTLAVAVAVILSITRPLREVATVAEHLARGDVSREVEYRSRDELGRLAASFRGLAAYIREAAELATDLSQGDLRRRPSPRSEHDLLGNAMLRTFTSLGELVGEIQRCGTQLSSAAIRQIEANSTLVSTSEETTSLATAVSTASEEMIASIADISRSTTEAAGVARNAVDTAGNASEVVVTLAEASREISGVVELIQAIASQTNLLALNATIEAARAGDAGKGFAVVADEVKRLALQTADATTTITQRVDSIESGAAGAAAAITEIGEIVERVNEIATTIAGALEEQTATTSEISRSVVSVAQAAGTTTQVTAESAESARALASMADTLQGLVSKFRLADV
jgi:methyl-accepting chemotaxis protein